MNAFDDFDETGFLTIEQPGKSSRKAELRLAFMKMRSAERVTLTFKPEILAEIGGPRFDVSWNPGKRLLLVKAGPQARFEAHETIRGVSRRIVIPLPAGLAFGTGDCEPEFYVDAVGKRLLIEVPVEFGRRLALPAPALENSPSPPTARIIEGFPREIGGQRFGQAEVAIIEALYRRVKLDRGALLAAIHDPDSREDAQDIKRVDLAIDRMRPRLRAAGIAIQLAGDNDLRMDSVGKGVVREALVQLGAQT